MVDGGQTACSMEVSSHALSLSRVYGIQFRAAAYLNLTRDHLDFHGDFKGYLDAKSILFSELPGDSTAVVNRDDAFADHILSVSRGANTLTFGESVASDIRPLSTELTPLYSDVALATPSGEMVFRLPIPGRYNISNAMAAAGIGLACGFPVDVIVRGLETVETVKGRYETVNEGQPFAVIVDYAHTPDALERILRSAREITTGSLIAVFGCGGDRDRGKRPIMGGIASREADFAIVTSDNPRTEDPEAIIADILEGIEKRGSYEVLPDREEAIRRALEAARPGDTVVIAGKGHEDYQIIGTERRHFDDSETARRILRTMA
jgi:UDP-N-acetylmuramoyl-L-alanyl-D-glutamate--2,6-diaminopimelate ligase